MAEPTDAPRPPISLAIVNDYSLVVAGLAAMLAPFADRVVVVEMDVNMPVATEVDVVLYDTFARTTPNLAEVEVLAANPNAKRVVVFSWSFDDSLINRALELGAAGYVSKTLSAAELVDALESVAAGHVTVSPKPGRSQTNGQLDWPGRAKDLSAREAEVLALITQGKSNAEITELLHLSINTVKVNIRTAYRKIGATNRVEAALWGVNNGMQPDYDRFRPWTT